MRYRELRDESDKEKEVIYEQIDELYRKGSKVKVREHRSGFPAITVDCEGIHILTDCLSLEAWYKKKKGGEQDATKSRNGAGDEGHPLHVGEGKRQGSPAVG